MAKFTQGGIYMFRQSRYLLFAVALVLSCGVNKNAQGFAQVLETTTPAAENIKLDTTTERIAIDLHLPTLSKQPLAPAKKVIVVPGDYPTIQAAIDAAKTNTVIHVKPGDYAESLNLKSGVSIKGLDANGVVIHCDAIDGPVIKADDCDSLIISDLTLKHTGLERMPADFDGRFPVLLLDSSKIIVARCKIQNSGGNGITIKGCNNTIWECNICNNNHNGISIMCGNVVLGKNNCSSNNWDGIHFHMAALGTVFGNICNGNVYQGIYASSDCDAFLLDNTCEENKVNGIYFNAGAKGRISKNTCTANGYSGIAIFGSGTTAFLEQNVTSDNNANGIYFGDKTGGEARNNKCSKNKYHGISVDDDWSTPNISANNCFDNKRCGLYLTQSFRATAWANDIHNNGEISYGETVVLLCENKYSILESIASRLRTEKSRYTNGNWQLHNFYQGVGDGWRGRRDFSTVKPQFEEWIKQQPGSITARIAMAKAYKTLAWDARGSGYANEVSEKDWETFKENLLKAQQILTEAEDLNAHDPELYETWVEIGMGLNKTHEEMDALFEKGIAIERNYWPLYTAIGFDLAPIWHGRHGELEAFARRAVELTRQDEGQILYAKIAQMMVGKKNYEPPQYKQLGFSYQMLKQSNQDLIERYPDAKDNYLLNASCFLACAYNDKDEAKDLLVQIGSNWNKSVLHNEDIFNKYKNWVLTKTEKSPEPNE